MARDINTIQAGLIADFQAQPELAQANSTSRRAIWRLLMFVQAGAILILEQIIDIFRAETASAIASAIPNTASWITKKVFDFQYSAINPQIVQLIDFSPVYPLVDASLTIVSRCSVVSTISNRVIVKVAKNEPPQALNNLEVSALQDYINTIGTAGITYTVTSGISDKLYINADVYYNGQYSSIIQTSVIDAINTYLANLPFNGQLKISDLELVIRAVNGVSDCLINDIKMRADSTIFADGTYLVQNKTTIARIFQTISGYVTEETTAGYTFSDSLNFISYV